MYDNLKISVTNSGIDVTGYFSIYDPKKCDMNDVFKNDGYKARYILGIGSDVVTLNDEETVIVDSCFKDTGYKHDFHVNLHSDDTKNIYLNIRFKMLSAQTAALSWSYSIYIYICLFAYFLNRIGM